MENHSIVLACKIMNIRAQADFLLELNRVTVYVSAKSVDNINAVPCSEYYLKFSVSMNIDIMGCTAYSLIERHSP